MSTSIEEIKDRLSIEDLVSQYVQLKKVGRSLKGLCPFHSEKSPSFIVSPDKGIAYCFGCNKGGDIFKFMQEIEGVEFADALKILAEKTGVKLENQAMRPKISTDLKEQLYELHEKVTQYYEQNLYSTEEGAKVLEYLKKRGLTEESIKKFRIGFAPDSYDKTHKYLEEHGFTKKSLVSAGLAVTKETTVENIYDKFRGRLMFPICDSMGRIVAFGGRALKADQEPKYLNSPETPIYHKSNILYGFFQGKTAIKQKESAVLCEGYMDLIALHQAGVLNSVATSGTALTTKHLRILKPLVKTLYLCFDMDLAGQEAKKRAYEMSQEMEFDVKVVELPEGKDPADFANTRAQELPGVIEVSKPYAEYYYDKLLRDFDLRDLSGKKKILSEFIPILLKMKSSVEKDTYVRKIAHDLDAKEVQIYDEIRNYKPERFTNARIHSGLDVAPQKQIKFDAAELILGLLYEFPHTAQFVLPILSEDYFPEAIKPIYKGFVDQYNAMGNGTSLDVANFLPTDLQEKIKVFCLYVSEKYGEVAEEVVESEIKALAATIKKTAVSDRAKSIQRRLMDAEKKGDKELMSQLLNELNSIYGSNQKVHNTTV